MAERARVRTSGRVASLTQRIVLQLHMMLRTLRVHEPSNYAFTMGLEAFKENVNRLWREVGGPIAIQLVDGEVFLNEKRVRSEVSSRPQIQALENILRERGLGGLSFKEPVEVETLRSLVLAFAVPIRTEEDAGLLRANLVGLLDKAVSLLEPAHFAQEEPNSPVRIDKRTFALQTYAKAIVGVREYIDAVQEGRSADPRLRLARIVMDLVDIASERVNFLLRLSTIKDVEDYPASHAANTCLLSIVIGRALGMNRLALVDLGMAALLADVGFALLPPEVLQSNRGLSEEERALILESMRRTVRIFFEGGRMNDGMMRRIIVALEHHEPYLDPLSGRCGETHLFSRIVQVADAFDALTTKRPWRDGFSADEALGMMQKEAGTRFDPVVLSLLVNLLGVYPLGSMVRLQSGEIGLVYHNYHDPARFISPWVKLLFDKRGKRVRGTQVRDLGTVDGPGGKVERLLSENELAFL